MKILSWNVNGIRAVVKKGFKNFLKNEKPDILCLQEIKISGSAREKEEFSSKGGPASGWDFLGYEEFWNSAERPGYSGTAILVRGLPAGKAGQGRKVKSYKVGLNNKIFDAEGRVQTMDLGKFYLVNAYFPNANHELSRLNFKLDFNNTLLKHVKKLGKSKPVIICGDFNVAHEEIDLARPKDNVGNPGFTDEERAWMTKFLKAGYTDTFRYINKNKIEYSWWSYRFNARVRNIGWRIDYFCVSDKMLRYVKNAFILNKIYGSDHCPVGIELK
ncbi:MAG: exodeoxyribonuclease III [Patescibacteria group bacterium]